MSADKKLDRMLKDWASHQAADAEQLASLRQRIGQHLSNEEADDDMSFVELPSQVITHRRRWVAIGLAASLLIAFGFWLGYSQQSNVFNGPRQIDLALEEYNRQRPSGISWSTNYVQNQSRLLTEYQAIFDQNIAWVVESEGRSDVGLSSSDSAANSEHDDYVIIQLVLWSRSPKESWKRTQVYNVLASQEEVVEVSTSNGEKSHLAIWAYPVDKDMISIDLNYHPPGLAGVQIKNSTLLRRRQSQEIHSFEQDGVEYKLHQIAEVLDDEVLNDDDLG